MYRLDFVFPEFRARKRLLLLPPVAEGDRGIFVQQIFFFFFF